MKKSNVDKAYEQGYAEGKTASRNHARGLRAQEKIEEFNRGVRIGGERMEAAKLGGITDLQQQLDKARAETTKWKTKYNRFVSSFIGEITRDD